MRLQGHVRGGRQLPEAISGANNNREMNFGCGVVCAGLGRPVWGHESFDRRIAFGMLCLVVGAAALSCSGSPTLESVIGPLAVIGACVAWGLDNNLTRKVSLADPLQIVALKGIIAGPINLLLGLAAGAVLPGLVPGLVAALVGFLCYGVSLALYVLALRHLGTARTAAYFSTAPFFGTLVAVATLNEPITYQLIVAGAFMAIGVWLHVNERHEHERVHGPQVHSHSHVHDESHQPRWGRRDGTSG